MSVDTLHLSVLVAWVTLQRLMKMVSLTTGLKMSSRLKRCMRLRLPMKSAAKHMSWQKELELRKASAAVLTAASLFPLVASKLRGCVKSSQHSVITHLQVLMLSVCWLMQGPRQRELPRASAVAQTVASSS